MNSSAMETRASTSDNPATEACPLSSVRSYGRTDVGRVRKSNQDHFLIAELARTMWVHQTSLPQPQTQYGQHRAHVFLVADGMGGHKGGEVASALTAATIEEFVLNVLGRFSNLKATEEEHVVESFRSAFQRAHACILEETGLHPEIAGMGTTLTMAFASRGKLFVVHAGDSRCYLYRNGELRKITSDHTIVAELVKRGVVKPEEAARHAYRHVVTNAVGGSQDNIHVEIKRLNVQPDDVLLLCSDGLTDMLSDERIAAILRTEIDPQKACDALVDQAIEQGGRDNVTAIVAAFDPFGIATKEN